MMKRAVRIIVSGKVQGVVFRVTTLTEAKKLDLKGFVMNLPDGDVFIEAEGKKEKVDRLIEWCKQGSQYSNVTGIRIKEIEVNNRQDFHIRYQ
jgi:acylphosphatase